MVAGVTATQMKLLQLLACLQTPSHILRELQHPRMAETPALPLCPACHGTVQLFSVFFLATFWCMGEMPTAAFSTLAPPFNRPGLLFDKAQMTLFRSQFADYIMQTGIKRIDDREMALPSACITQRLPAQGESEAANMTGYETTQFCISACFKTLQALLS